VQGVYTRTAFSFVERVVGNCSSEARTSSLGESVGSSTSKHESSGNGGNNNTSNNTSSERSGKYTNRNSSAVSSILFLARVLLSGAVDVALANHAVVLIFTGNINEYTTSFRDTSRVVANISCITHYGSMCARSGGICGQRITRIKGAQVVVVTELCGHRRVYTTKSSVSFARIEGTRVRIIARKSSPDALGRKRISEIKNGTNIGSTGIQIITVQIDLALGNRRAEIGNCDFSSSGYTSVRCTLSKKRNRVCNGETTSDGVTEERITGIGEALISLVAGVSWFGRKNTLSC